MTRLIAIAAFFCLAVPAAFAVPPAGDEQNAAKKCKAERAAMGVALFNAEHGTNANKKNAFGKCVSSTAKVLEEQDAEDELNAAKQCKAERAAMGVEAFNAEHGTNKNKKNAFGKCVSGKVKELAQEHEAEEQAELNAAKKCKAERGTTATSIEAFNIEHGTNKNKKNAFGKCVSKLAKQQGSSS